MGFTYSATLATNRDRVRFLLQDNTNSTARPALLDDGEIDWVLTAEHNIYMAAALCADALATRFRGLVSKTVGSLSLSYDSAAKTWSTIADRLRARGSTHQILSVGGVYEDDRDDIWEDTDLLRPAFFSGEFKNVGQNAPTHPTDTEENR